MHKIWDKCRETLSTIINRREKRLFAKNDMCVFSLAPNIPRNNREYKIYESYLNRAFKDPTIKNIAVTGNYGVGKSSFLKWFSRKKNFLFVSLCSFHQVDQNKDSLECNLIQQILIGCKPSGFRKYIWRYVICIGALSISLGVVYYLLATNKIGCLDVIEGHLSNIDIKKLLEEMKFYVYFIAGNMLFVGIPILIVWATSLFSLKKLSFKAADFETEFEIDEKHKLSFINLYRMELVETLICSAQRFDYTVVFEDMDRLKYDDCIALFTELREINRLVNLFTAKSRVAKKIVRFIYVIHDAVFNIEGNTTRVENELDFYQLNHLKFFDYIIPIIPQILDDAASNYIKSCFEIIGFHYTVEFISIVDKEIDDYRIIQNIANEYCVIRDTYKERFAIRLNEEDEKHIMALAVYKTLLPWDYQQIRKGKSILRTQELMMEDNCVSRLVDYGWLCQDCLKYIGLSEAEIKRYVENLFKIEQLEERYDIVHSVLEEKYLICRSIILKKFSLLYVGIIEHFGYSLLSLELINCKNDLLVLKEICRNSSGTVIRITEMYTNAISEALANYLKEASEAGLDEQILNVSIVFEYLLSFCDSDSKCFSDCECISSLFFFKCYLKLSEAKKNVMISNHLMIQCFNKAEEEPTMLNSILQLVDSAEAMRLLQLDNLDQPLINSLRAIIQKSST